MIKILILSFLFGFYSYAGTNNLPVETGRVIQRDHINKFQTALAGDFVPRDSSGNVGDITANLGQSAYRWNVVSAKQYSLLYGASTNPISLLAPNGVSSPYSLTFPTALPASTLPVSISSAGAISTGQILTAQITDLNVTTGKLADNSVTGIKLNSNTVDNSTLQYTSNQLSVKNQGITATQIANTTITASQIANATITGTQVANNINLPGTQISSAGRYVPVQQSNTNGALGIIRGVVHPTTGALYYGEGFTGSHDTTGNYTITFSASFGAQPVAMATAVGSAAVYVTVDTMTTTQMHVKTFDSSGNAVDTFFAILVIGPS